MTNSAELAYSVINDCVWLYRDPSHFVAPAITSTAFNYVIAAIYFWLPLSIPSPLASVCRKIFKCDPVSFFPGEQQPSVMAARQFPVLSRVSPTKSCWFWLHGFQLWTNPVAAKLPGFPCSMEAIAFFDMLRLETNVIPFFPCIGSFSSSINFPPLWLLACDGCRRREPVITFLSQRFAGHRGLNSNQHPGRDYSSSQKFFLQRMSCTAEANMPAPSRQHIPQLRDFCWADQHRLRDGYCCPLARLNSADRQAHLRMGPGVMTRLFL